MEYLTNINNKLSNIDENNIQYYDVFNYPELIHGTINLCADKTNFCKFPKVTQEEMKKHGQIAEREMLNMNSSSCGVRLRFQTNSKTIIIKVQLKRKWGYLKLVNWGSMGFDVYNYVDGKYLHNKIFGPMDGKNIFAEKIFVYTGGKICIFLPNYNTIEKMYIGIEKNTTIAPFDYDDDKKLPIVFYGNSVTQGAAASKSGNSFPNILSRQFDRDIINISCSSCCHGNLSVARLIGQLNCHSIIIDYTRNALNKDLFLKSHENFYRKIREFHPKTLIILLTTANFNFWRNYDEYDKIVIKTYENALKRGENVKLINQKDLFDENEFDLIAIDSSHYTDYGMFKLADTIAHYLNNDNGM